MASDDRERLRRAGRDRSLILGTLFETHRARLERMIALRMDPRLRSRLDPADVLQDTWVQVERRLDEFLVQSGVPFFVWLRFLTAQQLVTLARFHLGAQRRDVRRQVPLKARVPLGDASTAILAAHLARSQTTPSVGAMREELKGRIGAALLELGPNDREILALRHFEELTNAEAASELGLETSAASKRYLRALRRLRDVLGDEGVPSAG